MPVQDDFTNQPQAPPRCPHCHSPVEMGGDGNGEGVHCPSCGSTFHIEPDRTQAWGTEKLPQLGKFDLIEPVGRGAFGTVYRAVDKQLKRVVALKVPRSGQLTTADDEARFVREARNAAQLYHPGIVPVFEVGRDGQFPYIVSEFVEGITLADALTGRRFGFRESAGLIAQVAAALQHAHAQGVVHRDLKPANIMLTPEGSARVMDFGLAKRDAGEVTMTVEGQVLGTPAYMSPEQASGQGHHVDGRSDIYSLGSILYELLTGELPFRGNQRMLLHQVLHDEPRSPRSLNDRIPRDLETICLKSMSKEPARRYQSAEALADDLNRYLAGQPIAARPVGRAERSWRWCRRNPLVASLAATIALVLLAGVALSTTFAIEARSQARQAMTEKARAEAERQKAIASQELEARQRVRAQEAEAKATEDARQAGIEAEKANQVAHFLARMFEESAPFDMAGLRFGGTEQSLASANLTAREVLDRGADRVGRELESQPVIQATLKDTMGNVYVGLGIVDKAEALMQEALELRQQHLPQEHVDTASSLHSVGVLRFGQFRFAEAVAMLEEALAIRRKLLGDDHESVDDTRLALAGCLAFGQPGGLAHDVPRATALARESVDWRRVHLGEKHPQTALAMIALASALVNTDAGRGEAQRLLLAATPMLLNDPTTKSLGVIMTQLQQAKIMEKLGQRAGVVAATRRALAVGRDVAEDSHPFIIVVKGMAVENFIYGLQFEDAESLCRDVLQNPRKQGKPLSAIDAPFAANLARVLIVKFKNGQVPADLNEAESLYGDYLSLQRKHNATPWPADVELLKSIAEALQGRDARRAESLYREACEWTKEALGRQRQLDESETPKLDASLFAQTVLGLGAMLRTTARSDEADALYLESLPLVRQHEDVSWTIQMTKALADCDLDRREYGRAELRYREALQLADPMRLSAADLARWRSEVLYGLGDCLAAEGKVRDAEKAYREVAELGHQEWAPRAQASLAKLLPDSSR